MPFKIGILGAGSIAKKMAETLHMMPGVQAWAVASRDEDRARDFAQRFEIPMAYGGYERMLADPEVEMVYIATPHSYHYTHALLCLEAGKHVLCEKAFTKTAAEAEKVLHMAKERRLLAAEAIWTRYMPMAETLKEFCQEERIGRIWGLTANLGYPVHHKERIQRPELAGGALLDVGIYPLTFASIAFGDDITQIAASAAFSQLGVDLQNSVVLTYADGRTATLHSSVTTATDRMGILYGEKGYAIVDNINNFEGIRIYDEDHRLIEHKRRPDQMTGYEYEVEAAVQAVREGNVECPQMPHAEIIKMMRLMDRIRHTWGMWYPGEEDKNAQATMR